MKVGAPPIWFISDLHLFHSNMLRGGKIAIRPFDTLQEMHERIIEGWNSVVQPHHKIYMQGDLTLIRDSRASSVARLGNTMADVWAVVKRLNGHKRLLMGNHDHATVEEYRAMGFEKVVAYREMDGILFSHVPCHPSQFYRFKGNVHGHTHEAKVLSDRYNGHGFDPDPRYINVCVEPRNYIPISLEECVAHFTA